MPSSDVWAIRAEILHQRPYMERIAAAVKRESNMSYVLGLPNYYRALTGDVVTVAPRLVETLTVAARTLMRTTIRPELLLAPCGFFSTEAFNLFLDPSATLYLTNKKYGIQQSQLVGIVWHPGTQDRPDGSDREGIALWMVIRETLADGSILYMPVQPFPWIFGEEPDFGPDDFAPGSDSEYVLEQGLRAADETAARLFLAALLFSEQRLAVVAKEPHPRPWQARQQFDPAQHIPEHLVVTLRSLEHKHGEPTGNAPDWQYQWAVRGHWRQQFYASDRSHRPVWIQPYIKGPDDKPLKERAAGVLFDVAR